MKRMFRKLFCFLLGHKYKTKEYTILIINSRITLECERCNKIESYYGDGSVWRSLQSGRRPSWRTESYLADEQVYQHLLSLRSNTHNDHCS